MLHSLEWEGGNEPDANLSLCYIPWSGKEGMSQMPISPHVTFLGVEREGMSEMPMLHSLESKGGN